MTAGAGAPLDAIARQPLGRPVRLFLSTPADALRRMPADDTG